MQEKEKGYTVYLDTCLGRIQKQTLGGWEVLLKTCCPTQQQCATFWILQE